MDETSDPGAADTGEWDALFEQGSAYEVTVEQIQQALQRHRDTDE